MKKYGYYLFDYDLTLVDTKKGINDSILNAILKHPEIEGYDKVTNEQITSVIGMTLREGLEQLLPSLDDKKFLVLSEEYMKCAEEYMLPGSFIYPSTYDTLKKIKGSGAKIAIISLKHSKLVKEGLEDTGLLDFVDLVIAADDVTEPKPSPQAILMAMEKFNISDKSRILYVGDSHFDAETAKNAGVDFAGVTTGTTSREKLESYPHVIVMDSLAELI